MAVIKDDILYGAKIHDNYASAIAALNLVQMYKSHPVVSLYEDTEGEIKAVLVVGTQEGKGSAAYEIIATSADPSYIFRTITELEERINSYGAGFVYRGRREYYRDLPTGANNPGDIYHVINPYDSNPAGTNYVWNGDDWDALTGEFDLSSFATKEDFYSYVKDVEEIKDTFKKISYGSYSINFGQDSNIAEDFNLLGNLEIVEIMSENVKKCTLGIHTIIPDNNSLPIFVDLGEKLVWEIEREIPDTIASIGIKVKIIK